MRSARRAALLIAVWLLAWGDLTVANALSGVVVAVILLTAFPAYRPTSPLRVNPLGVVRLCAYVLAQLVPSNLLVAREVLARRSRIRTGVLAYPLQHPSDEVLSLMAHVIALTPGTMTVEATRDPHVLYVHFLLLANLDHARQTISRLESLAVSALNASEDVQ